ncbi:MAG: hypothetical protein GXP49_15615 [Deltaproteobacteria bacterium]|nr:hypothetical protein [Deltaproteobacteria bacterium]
MKMIRFFLTWVILFGLIHFTVDPAFAEETGGQKEAGETGDATEEEIASDAQIEVFEESTSENDSIETEVRNERESSIVDTEPHCGACCSRDLKCGSSTEVLICKMDGSGWEHYKTCKDGFSCKGTNCVKFDGGGSGCSSAGTSDSLFFIILALAGVFLLPSKRAGTRDPCC